MGGISLKLVLPTKRRIPTNDLIILSQAKRQGILIGITNLMEIFYAEVVIAGPEDKLQADLIIEECCQGLEAPIDDVTGVDVRVFYVFWSDALELQFSLAGIAIILQLQLIINLAFSGLVGVPIGRVVPGIPLPTAQDHGFGDGRALLTLGASELYSELLALLLGIGNWDHSF
jgi:hypothetical protein